MTKISQDVKVTAADVRRGMASCTVTIRLSRGAAILPRVALGLI